MAVQTRRLTAEEFDRFAVSPETGDRLFEYIGGEVVEVVSNQRSSAIAYRIGGALSAYLQQHEIGFLTGADGGYMIGGERYIPDIAFVSQARQAEPTEEAYSPIPPDLVVEVLSPSNSEKDIRVKVVNYLSAGAVVWVVDPEWKVVEVYTPNQVVKKVRLDGLLEGGNLLPGFKLAVKDIFKE
jgi:Uma2 family endonuclease